MKSTIVIPTTEVLTLLETIASTTLEIIQTETNVSSPDVLYSTVCIIYAETVISPTNELMQKLEMDIVSTATTESIFRSINDISGSANSSHRVSSESPTDLYNPFSSIAPESTELESSISIVFN